MISKTRSSDAAASDADSGCTAPISSQPQCREFSLPGGRTCFVHRNAGVDDASAGTRAGPTARRDGHAACQPSDDDAGRRRRGLAARAGRASVDQDCRDASRLQQEGLPLRIVSESDWLRLLGLDGRCREVHSLYTPAMLSRSLDVPIGTIRRWERLGLIRPVQKVFRLPYFDYAEAAGVRRLNELLNAGVPRSQFEASLAKIRHLLPGIERPLAQLNLLGAGFAAPRAGRSRAFRADDRPALLRFFARRQTARPSPALQLDDGESADGALRGRRGIGDCVSDRATKSADATGQVAGDSGPSDARANWSAEQWFAEGCRLLDAHRPERRSRRFDSR